VKVNPRLRFIEFLRRANYFKDSADERTVCFPMSDSDGTDGSFSAPRISKGDGVFNLFDLPGTPVTPNVRAAVEMDAYVFAAKWAR